MFPTMVNINETICNTITMQKKRISITTMTRGWCQSPNRTRVYENSSCVTDVVTVGLLGRARDLNKGMFVTILELPKQ